MFNINPRGKRRAISISKTRKIKVIRKNRNENGLRAFLKGENPHSKGVIFSRALVDFSLKVSVIIKIKAEIIKQTHIKIINISYPISK